MSHILKFKNPYGEVFYFLRLGEQWPHHPERRFIDATCRDIINARTFETEELAREVIAKAGSPRGWEVIEQ